LQKKTKVCKVFTDNIIKPEKNLTRRSQWIRIIVNNDCLAIRKIVKQ